jgi:hypothetical protein
LPSSRVLSDSDPSGLQLNSPSVEWVTQWSAVATRLGAISVPVHATPSLAVTWVRTNIVASSAEGETSPFTMAWRAEPSSGSSADCPHAVASIRVARVMKECRIVLASDRLITAGIKRMPSARLLVQEGLRVHE